MAKPWFRLYTEAVDDDKLRLLAFEDRWHFVAILCCKGAGLLDEEMSPLLWRRIAVKLGVQARELEEIARRLAEVGLIDGDTLQPLKWGDRQYESDTSKERTRKYRERMRKRHSDVTVTAQDTDTDTETEKKKPLPPADSQKATTAPANAGAKNKKGTRLNIDTLPDKWRTWAIANTPLIDPDLTFEQFRDYWIAKAGRDAAKLDWYATWRNWCRNARPPSAAQANGVKPARLPKRPEKGDRNGWNKIIITYKVPESILKTGDADAVWAYVQQQHGRAA